MKKESAAVPAASLEVAPSLDYPVVGIGASAGGLAAFEAFFSGMPAEQDPDMAFVLVQHLAPDHKSILTELIRRYTRMQVFEVEDGMKAQPNCVYIIPPNRDMAFLHGTLQLLEPAAPRGQRMPIDYFFGSLAADQRERAIGIVLSGTGSDGTQGSREIKAEGGMAMAQSPESTEFDGMPRSAIATGLIDSVLPPAEMATQLLAYKTHAFGRLARTVKPAKLDDESSLKKLVVLLRARTGHDFSQYKAGTTHRRIERRMAIHQIESMEKYVRYVQQTSDELDALFRDLLIGVTSFFRDPEAFQAFEEQALPHLLSGKSANAVLRVWCPGCSTGEEAYSLAMLFAERQESWPQGFRLNIFATDIDSQAIATARAGRYPASVAAAVSPERLARFFILEADGSAYRIHKSIRDLLVFSEQDVNRDPPFSKLDLISCRNLLIYLGGDLQKRLIPLFHYALKPGGLLFLGTSESIGESGDLFAAVDRKWKLYQRKADSLRARLAGPGRFVPLLPATREPGPRRAERKPERTARLRELTEQALLQAVAPSGALVNGQGDILYLHGRTLQYLEPVPGEAAIYNILKMAREGLQNAITTALHRASTERQLVRLTGLQVRTNGHFTAVNLTVKPLDSGEAGPPLYLVILAEAPAPDPEPARLAAAASGTSPADSDLDARIAALKQELQAKQEYLQTTIEELETANEELKSSNEEMQSVNEELQSTNEEMETSKEEMQSVNEELATVNNELQAKMAELSTSNNDMINLMAGTGIGTIFVDHELKILRFTPAATQVINFIPADVGRPVGHIVSNLVGYDRLVEDLREVLNTLAPKETEVQTRKGGWFLLRIRPYRTRDNVIEGAVITFVDISEVKKLRALERLAVMVRDSRDAITLQDLDGRTLAWNPAATRLYGWTEEEALAMNVRDRTPEAERADALSRVKQLGRAEVLESYLTRRLTKDDVVVGVRMTASALLNEAGQVYGIATTERLETAPAAPGRDQSHE